MAYADRPESARTSRRQTVATRFLGSSNNAVGLPEGLCFAWGRYGRHGITLSEVLRIEKPRADVMRLCRIARLDDDGGRAVFDCFYSGRSVFKIPEGLPCDVKFLHTEEEVS